MDSRDIIVAVMGHLNPWEISKVALCSHLHNEARNVYYAPSKRQFHTVTLTIPQYILRQLVIHNTLMGTCIESHKGIGRKILAIVCCGLVGVLTVNNDLKPYIKEFKRLRLYHADPTKTKVLVSATNRKRHFDYLVSGQKGALLVLTGIKTEHHKRAWNYIHTHYPDDEWRSVHRDGERITVATGTLPTRYVTITSSIRASYHLDCEVTSTIVTYDDTTNPLVSIQQIISNHPGKKILLIGFSAANFEPMPMPFSYTTDPKKWKGRQQVLSLGQATNHFTYPDADVVISLPYHIGRVSITKYNQVDDFRIIMPSKRHVELYLVIHSILVSRITYGQVHSHKPWASAVQFNWYRSANINYDRIFKALDGYTDPADRCVVAANHEYISMGQVDKLIQWWKLYRGSQSKLTQDAIIELCK